MSRATIESRLSRVEKLISELWTSRLGEPSEIKILEDACDFWQSEAERHLEEINRLREVVNRLNEVDKDTISISWSIDDVLCDSTNAGANNLTKDEAREVLSLMDNKHDACIGISWDTIDCWIDYVVGERT